MRSPARGHDRTESARTALLAIALAGLVAAASPRPALGDPAAVQARLRDGRTIPATLRGDERDGFRLISDQGVVIPVDQLDRLIPGASARPGSTPPAPSSTGPAPGSRLLLGSGGRISGTFEGLDDRSVRFRLDPNAEPMSFDRAGVRAITARPGEVIVLTEPFAALDAGRWTARGPIEAGANLRPGGGPGLRLGADAAVASVVFAEPLGAGRFELDWFDPGTRGENPDADAGVELMFRGPDGLRTVRIGLVTADESPIVKCTGGGPSLAVQRLLRIDGWRRLTVSFDPDRTQVLLDDAELAHGEGPGGPLAQVRLFRGPAARKPGNGDREPAPPGDPPFASALRLTRSTRALGLLEADPDQDEVRLAGGDQLFGRIPRASTTAVEIQLDPMRPSVRLPWADISGLHLRRLSPCVPSDALAGLWVRILFLAPGATATDGPDAIEGMLTRATAEALRIRPPYGDAFDIPLPRLVELQVLGERVRRVIDIGSHHLGSSLVPDLDPPQPGGPTLEKTFSIEEVPAARPIALAIDVIGVVGEEGDPDFSELVRGGELITRVILNGNDLGTLNKRVRQRNDTPLRILLSLPDDALRPGLNTIRFEQAGTRDDPNRLDNLGILGIGIEWPATRGDRRP